MVDDPQANLTQWTPLRPGGSSFTTHQLVDHAGKKRLRDDALRLRELIGRRVWDATSKADES